MKSTKCTTQFYFWFSAVPFRIILLGKNIEVLYSLNVKYQAHILLKHEGIKVYCLHVIKLGIDACTFYSISNSSTYNRDNPVFQR